MILLSIFAAERSNVHGNPTLPASFWFIELMPIDALDELTRTFFQASIANLLGPPGSRPPEPANRTSPGTVRYGFLECSQGATASGTAIRPSDCQAVILCDLTAMSCAKIDAKHIRSYPAIKLEEFMATYKMTEIVGTSPTSFAEATKEAVRRASKTLRNLNWFEVVDERGLIRDGEVAEFQVTIKIGFKLED